MFDIIQRIVQNKIQAWDSPQLIFEPIAQFASDVFLIIVHRMYQRCFFGYATHVNELMIKTISNVHKRCIGSPLAFV